MRRKYTFEAVVCKCGCGEMVPVEKMYRNGRQLYFVDRDHLRAYNKATGFYQRFSRQGLAAQREMQAKSGQRPGHEKRSAAAKRRRYKKGTNE